MFSRFWPSRRGLVAGLATCLIGGLAAGCSGSASSPAPSPASTAQPTASTGLSASEPPASSTGAPLATSTPASPSPASPSPTAPSPTAPLSTAEVSGPPAARSAAGSGAPAGPGAAVVQAIRFGDHGSFDRVVIEFTGTFGAWDVGYVPKVVTDPAGKDVPLAGTAFLAVRIQNATFDNQFQTSAGVPHLSYAGPHRITAGLTSIREIADAGDFEAVIGVGVGVAYPAGLRAYRLTGPSRLVIDVAH